METQKATDLLDKRPTWPPKPGRAPRDETVIGMEIKPAKVFGWLLSGAVFFFTANLLGVAAGSYFTSEKAKQLIRLFNMGVETSVPTFFSSLALISCAALLLTIALVHKKAGAAHLRWLGLAAIFLFLSIDEAASIHEILSRIIRESLHTSGVLFYAWTIPYGIALIAIALAYVPFFSALPRRSLNLFFLAGAIYVLGAMGLEMIGGYYAELHGSADLMYAMLVAVEEFLEMLGAAIFIYGLLDYLNERVDTVSLTVRSSRK